jgi:hypothetical protein
MVQRVKFMAWARFHFLQDNQVGIDFLKHRRATFDGLLTIMTDTAMQVPAD